MQKHENGAHLSRQSLSSNQQAQVLVLSQIVVGIEL